ncbi:Uncharacterized protein ZOSMA_116G00590 [Zostera marina]|uniref:Co-chaperone protein p23 n=1 Tax=Zostera marina TaxID=29655 RepID=A0A0K9Q249_ZOSMR|nr:Uncharacterized protein ZOSMA_116G00590 [Zostera marina]
MTRHPEVLWAQRSHKIYLTIALPDAKDVVIKCDPEGVFSFSATRADGESFKFDLELYGGILLEGSKINTGLRNIICSIKKENKVWWKRLLKSEGKPAPYIKVDWNKWCDESESDTHDSDDDYIRGNSEDNDSSEDDGLLYLPDLEKARRN